MRMLPWYRIKNTDSNWRGYIPLAIHDYVFKVINSIQGQGRAPSICLQVRAAIGMPIIDPYPGVEPEYGEE